MTSGDGAVLTLYIIIGIGAVVLIALGCISYCLCRRYCFQARIRNALSDHKNYHNSIFPSSKSKTSPALQQKVSQDSVDHRTNNSHNHNNDHLHLHAQTLPNITEVPQTPLEEDMPGDSNSDLTPKPKASNNVTSNSNSKPVPNAMNMMYTRSENDSEDESQEEEEEERRQQSDDNEDNEDNEPQNKNKKYVHMSNISQDNNFVITVDAVGADNDNNDNDNNDNNNDDDDNDDNSIHIKYEDDNDNRNGNQYINDDNELDVGSADNSEVDIDIDMVTDDEMDEDGNHITSTNATNASTNPKSILRLGTVDSMNASSAALISDSNTAPDSSNDNNHDNNHNNNNFDNQGHISSASHVLDGDLDYFNQIAKNAVANPYSDMTRVRGGSSQYSKATQRKTARTQKSKKNYVYEDNDDIFIDDD